MVWYSNHPKLEAAVLSARDTYAATGLLVITGPSGCGKSHLAEMIHDHCRKGAPLLTQGAASLEQARFESQLFGHEKGSFSGATQAFAGLLGAVGQGSLCLESVEDLDTQNQAKMLRLLQSRTYRGVGALAERGFRGGLLLTSRFGLRRALAEGVLREDFFFRIMGAELELPCLADRPMDFDMLFDALCEQVRSETGLQTRFGNEEDRQIARARRLAGNLHRLRNLIQQAVIRNVPLASLLDTAPREPAGELPDTGTLKGDLAALEKRLLARALERYPMSRKALAAHLGISARSLMYKLRDYGFND